eukprot:scaffold4805_cov136-Cylindrotheca_fusiformis.AAC.24
MASGPILTWAYFRTSLWQRKEKGAMFLAMILTYEYPRIRKCGFEVTFWLLSNDHVHGGGESVV